MNLIIMSISNLTFFLLGFFIVRKIYREMEGKEKKVLVNPIKKITNTIKQNQMTKEEKKKLKELNEDLSAIDNFDGE